LVAGTSLRTVGRRIVWLDRPARSRPDLPLDAATECRRETVL
jgi:hypothetical protein